MQSNLCITFFFSTLHITGKYKGLFPREYRKILTVRCTFTYCSECAGCVGTAGWAEPCTFWDSEEEEDEGGKGRGERKGTIHHFHLFVRKLFPVAARKEEKYRVSQMWTDHQRSSDLKKKTKKSKCHGGQMLKNKQNNKDLMCENVVLWLEYLHEKVI